MTHHPPHDFSPYHLLIVDDDARLRALIKTYLEDAGFVVTAAESAADARAKLRVFTFDAMVLDVMMPEETGIDFAKNYEAALPPIVFLTAKNEAQDRIAGLEAGGADYVSKPFEPRELVLRLNNIIEREAAHRHVAQNMLLCFADFTFDMASGQLQHKDQPIEITQSEGQLLRLLGEHAGEPVSREQLSASQSPSQSETLYDGKDRAVDVAITRLRKKLEKSDAAVKPIQTMRGKGYALMGVRYG